MFFLSMPKTFQVGDTADCKINGEPKRVTWHDRDTMVIVPGDARHIHLIDSSSKSLNTFMCADS